jgi:hypothetical protein
MRTFVNNRNIFGFSIKIKNKMKNLKCKNRMYSISYFVLCIKVYELISISLFYLVGSC